MNNDNYIAVIDVEASGFGRGSYPIEVGFVLGSGESYCMLIAPEPEWTHWDQDAESLHGISRELLKSHGRPIKEVADFLNKHLAGQVVYTDAWGNDSSWLGLLFNDAECSQHFKLESLCSLLTEEQKNIWHDIKDKVQLELSVKRHRASNDARLLQQTWLRICG